MIGQKWPSEMRTYQDEKTGNTVTQLTNQYLNFHFYFTDNSFTQDDQELYFLSNRGNPDTDVINLYHMDLRTGEMEQLTDDPEGIEISRCTKSKDGRLIAYITGKSIYMYHTDTKEKELLYRDSDFVPSHVFFNSDMTKLGFDRNEAYAEEFNDNAKNYSGFKERMFSVKDGRVCTMNLDGSDFKDVYCDTHWVSHFQFSPDDPKIAMFCHEGPWNYVQQRIWIINTETGEKWPCFRQEEEDCVGHEFWSASGDIIFDNRRGGHDGTVSSTKEQVYAVESLTRDTPYFGYAHKDGRVYRKIEMPYYCNHYYANSDLSVFVGDAIEDIVLIYPKADGSASLETLCTHNTTWMYQRSHPHPTFSWDGTKILYAADSDEHHCNIFIAKIPDRK